MNLIFPSLSTMGERYSSLSFLCYWYNVKYSPTWISDVQEMCLCNPKFKRMSYVVEVLKCNIQLLIHFGVFLLINMRHIYIFLDHYGSYKCNHVSKVSLNSEIQIHPFLSWTKKTQAILSQGLVHILKFGLLYFYHLRSRHNQFCLMG